MEKLRRLFLVSYFLKLRENNKNYYVYLVMSSSWWVDFFLCSNRWSLWVPTVIGFIDLQLIVLLREGKFHGRNVQYSGTSVSTIWYDIWDYGDFCVCWFCELWVLGKLLVVEVSRAVLPLNSVAYRAKSVIVVSHVFCPICFCYFIIITRIHGHKIT